MRPIRAARRYTRLVRLAWHMLCGLAAAHLVFPLLPKSGHAAQKAAIVQWWTRKLCRILAVKIQTEGEINPRTTLFVANHISWLDIPGLTSMISAVFVAKQEIAEWPLFGGMAARSGTLFLRRGDASAMTADEMTWMLTQKNSVIVFPEGGSSNGETVQHFHARLFQAAIRARCEVQAVAIRYPHAEHGMNPLAPFVGEDNLLTNLWALLAEPVIPLRLTFCEPLSACDIERRKLANLARNQIISALQQPAQAVFGETARVINSRQG